MKTRNLTIIFLLMLMTVGCESPKAEPIQVESEQYFLEDSEQVSQNITYTNLTQNDYIFAANVSYGPRERNVLDAWVPQWSSEPSKIVVFFHGGGFKAGDKTEIQDQPDVIQGYLENNYAIISVNYPFADEEAGVFLQDIMQDCARAIQAIRLRAPDYNMDPNQLYVYGSSAGGAITSWLNYHDDLQDLNSSSSLKQQSTKPTAGLVLISQFSLNFPLWEESWAMNMPSDFFSPDEPNYSAYGFTSEEQMYTVEGITLRESLDMYNMIDGNDPKIIFLQRIFENFPATTQGELRHHQRHMQLMHQKAQDVGAESDLREAAPHRFKHQQVQELIFSQF